MTDKVFSFYDSNNDRTRVLVQHCPIGYMALDNDNYDYDWPIGYGRTELEAIAELRDQMVGRELWPASFLPED